MIVKAKTVCTPEVSKDFTRFFIRRPMAIAGLLVLVFVFADIAYVSYLFIISKEVAGLIIVLGPFLFLSLLAVFLVIRNGKKPDDVFIFEFSDNKTVIDAPYMAKEESYYRYYNKVVYETNDYFYFFKSNPIVAGSNFRFFILRKADITEGSVSDLRELLESNRYVIKYKQIDKRKSV